MGLYHNLDFRYHTVITAHTVITIAAANDDTLKKHCSGLYTEISPKKIIQIKYIKTIKNRKVTL